MRYRNLGIVLFGIMLVGLMVFSGVEAQDDAEPIAYWQLVRFEINPLDEPLTFTDDGPDERYERRATATVSAGSVALTAYSYDRHQEEVRVDGTTTLTFQPPPLVGLNGERDVPINATLQYEGPAGACYGDLSHNSPSDGQRRIVSPESRNESWETWHFDPGFEAGMEVRIFLTVGCNNFIHPDAAAVYQWKVGFAEDLDADEVANEDDRCPESPQLLPRIDGLDGCPPSIIDLAESADEDSTVYIDTLWSDALSINEEPAEAGVTIRFDERAHIMAGQVIGIIPKLREEFGAGDMAGVNQWTIGMAIRRTIVRVPLDAMGEATSLQEAIELLVQNDEAMTGATTITELIDHGRTYVGDEQSNEAMQVFFDLGLNPDEITLDEVLNLLQ